jgi:hypothetical protein
LKDIEPERFVMALEMAKAVQTPLAPPDMSSPSSSFANLSFINSTSAVTTVDKKTLYSTLLQVIATKDLYIFFLITSLAC